jgi:hypothetical protein
LITTPFGAQVRDVALATRMFMTATLPWDCGEHSFVAYPGLGRTWSACSCCGFLERPEDRELLLRLVRSSS